MNPYLKLFLVSLTLVLVGVVTIHLVIETAFFQQVACIAYGFSLGSLFVYPEYLKIKNSNTTPPGA